MVFKLRKEDKVHFERGTTGKVTDVIRSGDITPRGIDKELKAKVKSFKQKEKVRRKRQTKKQMKKIRKFGGDVSGWVGRNISNDLVSTGFDDIGDIGDIGDLDIGFGLAPRKKRKKGKRKKRKHKQIIIKY